ncbi:MAG: hypothetical protein KJO26_15690 [Deltaproteobacteria bacterium]|nr:hypothetical protein [Deltaproteobacteria bacterium]
MTYKFGILQDNEWEEYRYGNVFAHEVYPDWSRVTIGADHKHISLMLDIAKQWEGPYDILYVLVVPRSAHGAARYQSPEPCSFDDLELFAYTFQEYFEGDGRHHVWFMDISSNYRIIYDNHDLIYTYGNDNAVMGILEAKGFKESSPQMPAPHGHCFNQELDKYEGEIMAYFEWITFPLNVEHDDP